MELVKCCDRRHDVVEVVGRLEPDEDAVIGDVEGEVVADRRSDDRAVVEGRALAAIDGRLAMLGADDDQGVLAEVAFVERRDHLADRGIDERDGIGEIWARRGERIGVAAALELLSDADGLKVHAEQCRGAQMLGPGMIEAVDLGENGLNLDAVIPLDGLDRAGEILAWNQKAEPVRSSGGRAPRSS